MTIDQMMVEIRNVHPSVCVLGNKSREYRVYKDESMDIVLGRSPEKHRAVELAFLAVRKAQHKPMTVAQAKAIVKAEMPNSWCGKRVTDLEWTVWNTGIAFIVATGITEGRAWKTAAEAIVREGK